MRYILPDDSTSVIPSLAPVAWFSTERGDGEDEYFVLACHVDHREAELLEEHPSRSVEERRSKVGILGRADCGGLNGLVEAFAELATDGCVVVDFVHQLETRLAVVADRFHR